MLITTPISPGWSVFAVQYNQECYSGPDAAKTYEKYGRATNCNAAGTGGGWANNVYGMPGGGSGSFGGSGSHGGSWGVGGSGSVGGSWGVGGSGNI